MRKFLLSILCAVGLMSVCNNADAQVLSNIENIPPYKLGVTAGFNASSFSANRIDPKAGFNIGADLMLDASDLIPNTFVRINLLLQRKGARYNWEDLLGKYSAQQGFERILMGDTKVRVWSIEIPVAYGYAYRLNGDWAIFGETGPYFGLGLGGNYKSDGMLNNGTMSFYGNDIRYEKELLVESPKRLDIGWGFAVGGMLWNQHQFKMGYQIGFININDVFQQNRNFMINYTYFFE